MGENNTLESLFESAAAGALNEEAKKELVTILNETVDARVSAKEKLLKEEYETLKESITKEAEELKTKILTEAEENEKVLIEEAEKYKKELEETIVEETIKFKTHIESEKEKEITEYRNELETVALQEAKEFKDTQDAVLVEEVKKFKAELTDKVSDYLETKLLESIPAEIMEAATKVAVLEPLVGAIMEGFSKNFVKLDTTSYKLIKEAKEEIAGLESTLQELKKNEVKIKKEIRDVNRTMKIQSLTEGLTQPQKDKAVKLLEDVDYEELDSKFSKIRDIVIESPRSASKVSQPKKEEKLIESANKESVVEAPKQTSIADKSVIDHQVKKVLSESEVKQITGSDHKKTETLNESVSPEMKSWVSKVKPKYIETPKK